MRIFKIKEFSKWAKKHDLSDSHLVQAVKEIESGLVEANLGGNLYKKRIATKGRGKRGSVRTLLAYVKDERTFFLFAYEKSDLENISKSEKEVLQLLGNGFLEKTEKEIDALLKKKAIFEVEGKDHENER